MLESRNPIVVGTDGSATASRAVERAGRLADALGVDVHIVIGCSEARGGAWMAAAGGIAVAAAPVELQQEQAEAVLADAMVLLARLGVASHSHICGGDPADALLAVADDVRAQMIVVGNRGMHGARRMLGSVPNRVSHHAGCAVMIVPTS
jgi:nucleotide-binding universal stress UspA family protein